MQNDPILLPAISLCQRELVRFLRQRNRIIGALATPALFWVVIGLGIGKSFSAQGTPGGADYLEYFFPGTIIMILLFTALFSTISIIEDRQEGFLQGVLVAPISRQAIVLGKLLGGSILAAGQGLIFLLLAPLVGVHFTPLSFLAAVAILWIVGFALTGLGFCIAWRMSSTQGFHAILNLFLMPLWFLSGALFPARGAMRWVIGANPLSYGLAGLRHAMYWNIPAAAGANLPSWQTSLLVSLLFAAVMFFLAAGIARSRVAADLQ